MTREQLPVEGAVVRVPVFTREIFSGDGSKVVQHTVYCPRDARWEDLSNCVAQRCCGGVASAPDGRHMTLICREAGTAWPPLRTPVAAAMARDVACARPDVSEAQLIALFEERHISGVPVVDEEGRAVGVVSKSDLVRHGRGEPEDREMVRRFQRPSDPDYKPELGPGYHDEALPRATVQELMTPLAYTLRATTPIAQAAALMAFEGIHRVPVVNDRAQVVGLLSTLDVLRWMAETDGYLRAPQRDEI